MKLFDSLQLCLAHTAMLHGLKGDCLLIIQCIASLKFCYKTSWYKMSISKFYLLMSSSGAKSCFKISALALWVSLAIKLNLISIIQFEIWLVSRSTRVIGSMYLAEFGIEIDIQYSHIHFWFYVRCFFLIFLVIVMLNFPTPEGWTFKFRTFPLPCINIGNGPWIGK